MFSFVTSGSFTNTERWLHRASTQEVFRALDQFGARGVSALAAATPQDTGKTASSWTYEIKKDRGSYSIIWSNTHIVGGAPLAIMLQYGHGTGTGGYVQGRDYINPAMRPIFDQIINEAMRVVMSG